MGIKQIPTMGTLPVHEPPQVGYRGRFEDVPPGLESAVPGFEPSPFEKPPFGPPGPLDRDRLPQGNYRDPYRPPFADGPAGFRDMPLGIPPGVPNELPVHMAEPPRYREGFRGPQPFREPVPQIPFKDSQPFREPVQQQPFREPNFRNGPPGVYRENNAYRNAPYRDGPPGNYPGNHRDNPPHNYRDGPAPPFRPPSADPREVGLVPGHHDSNFRDERDHRGSYRPGRPDRNRGVPSRRPGIIEHERHRDRERYVNDTRDPADRARELERKALHEKGRDSRDERPRDYERSREYPDKDRDRDRDREREREYERNTPDKKGRLSPKRDRRATEGREKKRSESRGRSRDRDIRREKKDERARDKSSADRSKDKDRKLKERKKKKKEKEKDKDTEKKKKREKKEKKEKETVKKEEEDDVKPEVKVEPPELCSEGEVNVKIEKEERQIPEEDKILNESEPSKEEALVKKSDDLYGEDASEAIDKEIIQNYVKTEESQPIDESKDDANKDEDINNKDDVFTNKDEPFDGIELQVNADELDLKAEGIEGQDKEVLAPMPALSKWEVDDDNVDKTKEPGEITPEEEEDTKKVTSEVIKRAENAIFAKAISSLKPIEIKKISGDRLKLYAEGSAPKSTMNNIQITVPVTEAELRSIEVNERKRRHSKTPPPKLSIKERLGGKIDDARKPREPRVVHSTVERVKSRSKTPKRDQHPPYRRVTVEKDRSRKVEPITRFDDSLGDRRSSSETYRKMEENTRNHKEDRKRDTERSAREERKPKADKIRSSDKDRNKGKYDTKITGSDRERKKSTLDEAHFEPDYDETVETDNEAKEDLLKKRDSSKSPVGPTEIKKPKLEEETIKLDLTNVKKKPETGSESSSDTGSSSSSSSSETRKRKKKKKRTKKSKKKRAASDSDSDSESDSDDHKKKKKKRKHKKKSSKKKKKSKHK